jgi:MoaA/NifB/PqqE/SkfB family radical SAM enzyme
VAPGGKVAPVASVAVVFLTPACGMACPYCGADDHFGVLGRAQARALMASLSRDGFSSVVLGGGEPLLWPHGLRELCTAARSRGLLVQVGSSAADLPADAAQWREVDRWVLPLESADPPAHDALRPLAGRSHHALVLKALHAFALAGVSVTVSSVARRGGEADLRSVGALLMRLRGQGLRLHAWHLYRFQAMGRHGADNGPRFALDDGDWAALGPGLKAQFPALPLLLRPDMMHSKAVAFFWATPAGIWRQGPLGFSGLVAGDAPGLALR